MSVFTSIEEYIWLRLGLGFGLEFGLGLALRLGLGAGRIILVARVIVGTVVDPEVGSVRVINNKIIYTYIDCGEW